MKYLLFRGDPAGMSNVKMGLDIGVGLAHLTNRVLVVYENDALWEGARPIAGRAESAARPTVLDLFDVPVPHLRQEFLVPALADLSLHRCSWSDLVDAVYYPPDVVPAGARFEAFRNGRENVYTIDARLDEYEVIQIDSRPLAHYSHFFYLPDERRRGLLRAMAGVRAKQAYREFADDFADQVAGQLGAFNAVHLRRTDTKSTTPRNAKVTGEEIIANLREVFPTEQALLICTDESSDTEFFTPILDAFPHARFLDRLVLDDPAWAARLRALPFAGDPVLALVTQLVASRAERFAGSLISTFTALIQRMRGQRDPHEPFLFAFDQFVGVPGAPPFSKCQYQETRPGPFSWNRLGYPMEPRHHTWIREWPEAFSDEFGDPAESPPRSESGVPTPREISQAAENTRTTTAKAAPHCPVQTLEQHLYALHMHTLQTRQRVCALEVAAKLAHAGRTPRMPVEFRSQHGEDVVIWEILGGQTEGFFLEVGAFDGYQLSVTYALEAAGWRGLLIEALPERSDQCRMRRVHSRVVHAAVSAKGSAGSARFVIVPEKNGMLSYLDQDTEHARLMAMVPTPKQTITVPLRTIDELLGGHEGPMDAAIIDVEGAELDALDGFDIGRWRPRVLFLEDNQLGRDPALAEYMATKPYVSAGWVGCNRLYVHRECTDVLERMNELGYQIQV